MSISRTLLLFSILFCGSAAADVWKWVDAEGKTHFVDTTTAIFTWEEDGRIFYSDKPGHEDAIAVQLVWVAKGTLENMENSADSSDGSAFAGETPGERAERQEAEAGQEVLRV